jgi:hypothetical protein
LGLIEENRNKNMIGRVFGKLTVLNKSERKSSQGSVWNCKCECGGFKEVLRQNLLRGDTKSCGCLHKNRKKECVDKVMSQKWYSMISRTENPNDANYFRYGGRGIFTCEEWKNDFFKYCEDVGNPPFVGAELDRIDNDDGYYKENVRWVTTHQNIMNTGGSKSKNATSKYKGVSFHPVCGLWRGRIKLKGKVFSLGYFKTPEEAGLAYNKKAKELFGDHAYLNKIEEVKAD